MGGGGVDLLGSPPDRHWSNAVSMLAIVCDDVPELMHNVAVGLGMLGGRTIDTVNLLTIISTDVPLVECVQDILHFYYV